MSHGNRGACWQSLQQRSRDRSCEPIPGAAIVLLGVTALAIFKVMKINDALAGYADPVVWLVLAAFFISRGMIKTDSDVASRFSFIKAIGRHSLGLSYALARRRLSWRPSYHQPALVPAESSFRSRRVSRKRTSPTRTNGRRLGAFLMTSVYQCNVIVCAMF